MNKHWSERLTEWTRTEGWTWAELARRTGVPVDSIHKYRKGGVAAPRGSIMDDLARPFGRTGKELHYGVERASGTAQIPLLGANEVGTMTPSQEINDVWGGVRMTVVSADLAENTFSFEVYDNACAPKFEKGDTVICEEVQNATPGKFVVARVEGLGYGVLRRYRPRNAVDNSRFALIATNEDFPDIEVDAAHPGFIVGQVVKVIKDA